MNPDHYAMYQWPAPGGSQVPRPLEEKVAKAKPALTYDTSLSFLVKQAAEFVATHTELEKVAAAPVTNLWRDPEAHPLVLALVLLDTYGDEVLGWDGEVLRVTLIRDSRQPTGSVWTKIQAVRTLLNSPSPWRQWEVLHWLALGLAGEAPNFIYMEQPDLGHIGACIDMMRIVDPSREFGEEVDKFVATVLKQDGFPWAPPPLTFCQDELEDRKLRCTTCGALHRNDNDVRCISCGAETLELMPYEFATLRDEVAAHFNAMVDLPLSAAESLPDTSAGNVAYALLEKWDYVEEIRLRLARQLKALKAAA